jgi:hypothetical protein
MISSGICFFLKTLFPIRKTPFPDKINPEKPSDPVFPVLLGMYLFVGEEPGRDSRWTPPEKDMLPESKPGYPLRKYF